MDMRDPTVGTAADTNHVTVAETVPVPRFPRKGRPDVGRIVLVLQGGGALGAYQAGIYEALHEAGIEPDWVIGTSIGAINAGIVAAKLQRIDL